MTTIRSQLAIKLIDRYVRGWSPTRPGGRKHRYYCLPALTVVASRAVWLWIPTQQYYLVDYDPIMSVYEARKAFIDLMELNWPSSRIQITPIVIAGEAMLHHSPPTGWSLALHGDTPRQLVYCEGV